MKQFMFLHFGFERPSPEIMQAWFSSIAEQQIGQGEFKGSNKISKTGSEDLAWDLAWDLDSTTGDNIIEAEDMAAAEKLALRICELRTI